MTTRNKLTSIDPADLGTAVLVTVGSAAASEHFSGDELVPCDNCGVHLRHVFVTSSGLNLGGDCLASLSGDDSTRAAVVRIGKKNTKKGIVRVGTLLGGVIGETANGQRFTLACRPDYMNQRDKYDNDLHPKDRERALRLAAGLATVFSAELI